MRLSDMREHQSALITKIEDNSLNGRRLCDLGFIQGQRVKCTNIAMLGTPIAYEIQGAKIALRKTDARGIIVLP